MAIDFKLGGQARDDKGKGASRRLRRQGKVPAILYGGGEKPLSLTLDQNEIKQNLGYEAFYSRIITLNLNKKPYQVVLKDLQRHPAKNEVLHVDLQRVKANEAIRVHIPLHFLNQETAPGVKEGGVVSHHLTDVEIDCLPKDLPEHVKVDIGALNIGDSIHLSELDLPSGVTIVALSRGEHAVDEQVVSVHHVRASVEEEDEATSEGAEGDASADNTDESAQDKSE